MKYFFFLLALACFAPKASSQITEPSEVKSFIPDGYRLLLSYDADLNADSLTDKIIVIGVDKTLSPEVLKKIFPPGTNLQKRPVIICLRQADRSLKRVSRNDEAVVQDLAVKDPFTGIRCSTGTFTIEHVTMDGSQQCTVHSRFEWIKKQNDWYLKEYSHACISLTPQPGTDGESFKEKTPKNFGKITFGKYRYPMSIEIDEWGQ